MQMSHGGHNVFAWVLAGVHKVLGDSVFVAVVVVTSHDVHYMVGHSSARSPMRFIWVLADSPSHPC
jgi:hypothetical protein